MPKISVIMPAYNSGRFIGEAIESVIKQTYPDLELIVIDDDSRDSTRSIVEDLQKKFPEKIRYIRQENGGPSKARNAGINQARGEYIAFLDADDIWHAFRLQEGMAILEKDPQIALVHGNITGISESGKAIKYFSRKIRFLSGQIFEHLFLRKADIATSTVLLRKYRR